MTTPKSKAKIMHVVDTLEIGGAERVAVNLVNNLPQEEFELFLCTTRYEGSLTKMIAPHVKTLNLHRRSRYDLGAIFRLVSFVRRHNVDILHAHSTSLFISAVVAALVPAVKVIWHDHYGQNSLTKRPVIPYMLASKQCNWVISVNHDLAAWVSTNLKFPLENITYVPNFVIPKIENSFDAQTLPGCQGYRIVCLANLRRQKDHATLLEAFAKVIEAVPKAHLLVIGKIGDESYYQDLVKKCRRLLLEENVTWMGQREDAFAILQKCDVGVLSSLSEGLPLVLLEYGFARLATIATQVGQCPEVLDQGKAGLLVTPGSPHELAEAIVTLLDDGEKRRDLGKKLQQRVETHYSVQAVLPKIQGIYRNVML